MNRNSTLKNIICSFILFFVINLPGELFAANGTIKASENHQTMVGFGASIAWADDQLASHPKKDQIYYLIFNDLGLDILRIRNVYRNDPNNFTPTFVDIVENFINYSPTLPKILISSWSPPANLKSNGTTDGGGTLIKDPVTSKYEYGAFAQYWVDAIKAYRDAGIEPDYITIQNEPDFSATWESCVLGRDETTTNAGYNRALDTVYAALQQLESPPKILGPEVLGIGYNEFQNYAQYFNRNHLDGYAYHLYHGESDNVNDNHNPDLFKQNLTTIANSFPGKPIFQTEYDRGDWFNTAWLIHNCLVYGNVSAYFWWELVWGSGSNPLIEMQGTTYTISKYYWAFRQYSRFISSDWRRVTATDDADSLRISAFVDPTGQNLTVVILNISSQTLTMNLNLQDFNANDGMVIRTSETESGDTVSSHYDGKPSLDYPKRSITTISLVGNLTTSVRNQQQANPIEYSLAQNFPNPFNPSTTIEYSIPRESYVSLKVYDVLGREVATLVDGVQRSGTHESVFNSLSNKQNELLMSGVYFYTLFVDGYTQTRKMILLK